MEATVGPPARLMAGRPIGVATAVWGLALAGVGLSLFAPMHVLVALFSDDAFYYFQIARNIVTGRGCTFDGITTTNGFHPLWMALLLPVFHLADGSPELPVRLALTGCFVLTGATLTLLYRVVQRDVAPGFGAVAVAVCFLPLVLATMTNGLETGLLLFTLVAMLRLGYRLEWWPADTGFYRSFLYGLALGLVALARLDAVFVFGAAVLLTMLAPIARDRVTNAVAGCLVPRGVRGEWPAQRSAATSVQESPSARESRGVRESPAGAAIRPAVRRIMALGLGFAVVTFPYIAWNVAVFGHLMPISGAVKSTLPGLAKPIELRSDHLEVGAILLGCMGLCLLPVIIRHRMAWRRAFRSPLTVLVLACGLHFVYAWMFLEWGVYWWHFSMYGLALALLLPAALYELNAGASPARARRLGRAVTAGLLVVAIPANLWGWQAKGAQHREWLAAAAWAERNTPPEAIFAIKDAGLFAWFSHRRTINLDGKANSREYQDYLRAGRVWEYLRNAGTTHVAAVHARYSSRGECRIVIPRTGQAGAVLSMRAQDEVYRGDAVVSWKDAAFTSRERSFLIWRMPPESGPS